MTEEEKAAELEPHFEKIDAVLEKLDAEVEEHCKGTVFYDEYFAARGPFATRGPFVNRGDT